MNSVTTTDQQATGGREDWRARIGGSRAGTMLVLSLTAVLVMGAAYLVERPTATDPGVSPVTLTAASDGAPPEIGRRAPDFTATTIDGEQVSLDSYRGRPVWLTFGATWCASCQAEFPDVEAAYQKSEATGLVVLAVFINEDSSTVRDYSDRVGLTFPEVADPDTRIASAYRVLGIPVHFFIDRSGVLRSVKTGSLSPERMDAAIAKISR